MHSFQANNLTLRAISYGSADYEETVVLREAILRHPLGLFLTRDQLEAEYSQYHLAAYQASQLVGCLILLPLVEHIIKMRQVAIAPSAQRRGVGSTLVQFSEAFALNLGFTTMTLHARETAVPFYEKLGYKCVGERFQEVLLPHCEMHKSLS